ncbi:MAG: PQQ-binding-like beta-propeller repeat protein [Vicinamibacterales bacterium]
MSNRLFVVGAWLALSVTASTQAPDWNQWRGSNRDGAVHFAAPATWPDRPTQVWKVTAGIGHASPVVSAGRIYLLSRISEQEAVTCFDALTGAQIWRQVYDAPYQVNPAATGHGKGPKSTPLVDRGRVYTFGISGILSAFESASGKVLWRQDFKKVFPATSPDFGTSMSPLIDGEHLIAHAGGEGNGALIAFDRTTGAQKWSWKGDGPGYASPIIATFAGTRHLITQTQSNIVGIAPADGRLLWKIPFTTDFAQNIITPVVADGVLIYAGLAKPTTAVRLVLEGGTWKPQQVWQNADIPMYMSSPVIARGVLYGLTHRNRGQFFAVDAATGKTLWTSPPRQAENAALARAGESIIATTTEGELVIMKQGRIAFAAQKKYTVADSPVWAHPAFSRNGIVIKDAETLSVWSFQGGRP